MRPLICLRGFVNRSVLVVAALCFAISVLIGQEPQPPAKPTDLTPEQQEKLKERDRLKSEMEKLRKEEKLAEAVTACEKLLAIERGVWGELHDDVVASLNHLAELHEKVEDWPAAEKHREEVLRVKTKRYGENDWRVGDARRTLADGEHFARMPDADRRDLNQVARLHEEVVQLNRQGKYREAADLERKSLAIRQRLLGEEHPDTARSLNNLGSLVQAQGDYAAAKPYLERALAIRKKALGPAHRDTGKSLNNLGVLLKDQGDLTGAKPYFEQALEILKKAMGPDHPETAAGLNSLGYLLWAQADYAGAKPYFEQALVIWTKALGPEHPDTATGLVNLGALVLAQGNHAGAQPYFEQALAIRKKTLGSEHPDTATTLHFLGSVLTLHGDYARAKLFYEKAVAIQVRTLGPEHPDTAAPLYNLGELLRAQGDYAAAMPHFEQALAIRKKTLGPEHPDIATSLNGLGHMLQTQGNYAAAKPYFEQALAIRKKTLGADHPDTATSLNNLGFLLQYQGDYAGATPFYEQALTIRKKTLGLEHPHTAASLTNLAYLLQTQGHYAEAKPYYEQALTIRKKTLGPEHADTARSLSNLGGNLYIQGDYAAAKPYFDQALAILHKSLDLAADGMAERQQLAMLRSLPSTLDAYLGLAAPTSVSAAEAYRPILVRKGGVLARQQRAHLARRHPELNESLDRFQEMCLRLSNLSRATPGPLQRENWRRALEKLTRQKEALEVEMAQTSAAFARRRALQRLTPDELQKALPASTALVDLFAYVHFTPPPDGKGPMMQQRRIAAFVVRPDRPIVQSDLGPLAPITSAVDKWRESHGGGDMRSSTILREQLWQPLEHHLEDVITVLISPDDALSRFPFAALPGKAPGTYLIEERTIAVLPVPQLLPELLDPLDKAHGKEPSLMVVGDVDFGATPGGTERVAEVRSAPRGEKSGVLQQWGALPNTRSEVVSIKDSFQRRYRESAVTELRESDATEHSVRQHAPNHRYLHFATHGFFAPPELKSALAASKVDVPLSGSMFGQEDVSGWHPGLLSGLVLAGANQPIDPERDDGILTSLEVAALDLSGVDLAVLSACETGLGEVAGGEGILGLQRAFQTAGARSVVAGLWKVPDRATQMLMTKFYENLWDKKMSKLEALRQAQIWMLREVPKDEKLVRDIRRDLGDDKPEQVKIGDGSLPPYYWAGFVLSGDWR